MKSTAYSSKIEKIRALTLEDLNNAVNTVNGNSDRASTSRDAGFKELTGSADGLFDMRDLIKNDEHQYSYWLISSAGSYKYLSYAKYNSDTILSDSYYDCHNEHGLRPVIVLSEDAQITYDSQAKIFKIN